MEIIAHRGSSGRAPENTLAALAAALEDRADAVEVDVQGSADGELILLHDATFARTAGDPHRPAQLPLARIQALGAGAWFGAAHAGERVPTLRAALDLLAGRVPLHVEVKATGDRSALARRLLEVLDLHPHGARTFISSADRGFLAALHARRPHLGLGLVLGLRPPGAIPPGVGALSLPAAACGPRRLAWARARGLEVRAYTVNDRPTLERLAARGVAGVFTDWPARLSARARAPVRAPP